MTGRDVTPNLRTNLAYPDAQAIHLHGLSLNCSCPSSLAYHREAESIGIG
jgi:hypothetical protein